MTSLAITINGKKEFDGELAQWSATSPDFIKDVIKPGIRPAPHMMGIMMAMTDAITSNRPTSIDVKTWNDGWTMTVKRVKQGRKLK